MFGLFVRKRPIVHEQWIVPILDFVSDTSKFYTAVEDELKLWEVPELTTERMVFKDAGFLSSGREYLRVRRESLVFDILSAKFGKSWWFSCRSAVLRRKLRLWEIFAFVGAVAWLFAAYWYAFGFTMGCVAIGSSLAMLLVIMVSAPSWNGLDDLLLHLPIIGAFYESIFRAESYYRDDARRMYVSLVDYFVREKVKEFAAAGGADDVKFNDVKDINQLTSVLEKVEGLVTQAASEIMVTFCK